MSNATDAVDLGHRLPTPDEIACASQAVTALADARGGNGVLAIRPGVRCVLIQLADRRVALLDAQIVENAQ